MSNEKETKVSALDAKAKALANEEKNRAYYRLSQEMGMKSENCHFGYMDYEQLVEAYI